jgi:acyl carrier protein
MTSNSNRTAAEQRIANVVRELLAERSISTVFGPDENLREIGLTSVDIVNLVLSVEAEFDFTIPEGCIIPANFRSVSTIGLLVATLMGNSDRVIQNSASA